MNSEEAIDAFVHGRGAAVPVICRKDTGLAHVRGQTLECINCRNQKNYYCHFCLMGGRGGEVEVVEGERCNHCSPVFLFLSSLHFFYLARNFAGFVVICL